MSRRKRSLRRALLIAFVAADVLLLAVAGWIVWQLAHPKTVITHVDMEQLSEEERAQISEAMLSVYYSAEARLKDGRVQIMLSNGDDSGYFIRADLLLIADGRSVGRTDLIDPGYRLESMPAQIRLRKGDHPCLLRIELFDEEGNMRGSVGRQLLLRVEE